MDGREPAMQKQIGNVILDYTYYKGRDLYSDGEIEDFLLHIVKTEKEREVLYTSSQWPVLYHLSDIRENIIEWYPFASDSSVLEIGSGCGALTGILSRKAGHVTCIELSEKRSLINAYRNKGSSNIKILLGNFQDIEIDEKYDYVTLIGVWEYSGLYVEHPTPYLKMLEIVKSYLKKDGKIIIAIENKMGLKYWNGASEDHTGKLYSGLNDYTDCPKLRTFSKPEIECILKEAGISEYTFYYPMPDYKLPETIYSDNILPMPGWERNYGKDYDKCRVYNFNDAVMSDQVCQDRMFPYFANSFLVIAGQREGQNYFERYNRQRKEQFRIKTEIIKRGKERLVKKSALNPLAQAHILHLKSNEEKWKHALSNIKHVEGYLEDGDYICPYIEGEDLETVFYKYRNDIELFAEKYSYYIQNYFMPSKEEVVPFKSSENFVTVFGEQYPHDQKSMECTNVDMIFSNVKVGEDGQLYCYDYEWIFDFPIPYEYVLWRGAKILYEKYMAYLKRMISKQEFLVKVGISQENIQIYEAMERNFGRYVTENQKYLHNYRKSSIMQAITIT